MAKPLAFLNAFLSFGCLLIFSVACSEAAVGELPSKFNNARPKSHEMANSGSQQASLRQMPDTDFEDGTMDPWYDFSSGDVHWVIEDHSKPSEVNNPSPEPLAGTKYLRVLRDSVLDSGPVTAMSKPFLASPGDTVTFSFWIQSNRTQNNDLQLIMVVGNTETVLIRLSRYSSSTNFEWREVDPIPIPVTEPTTIEFMLYGYCGNDILDAIAVDNIAVTISGSEVTTTTTTTTVATPSTTVVTTSTTPTTITGPSTTLSTTSPSIDSTTTTATTTSTAVTTSSTTTTTSTPGNCGGSYSGNGSFFSPNYPGNYDNNLDCRYLIRVSSGKVIYLTFSAFNTESDRDFLEIYDGSTIESYPLGRHSGPFRPYPVRSSSNEMLVRFTTDGSNVLGGFSVLHTEESIMPDCGGNFNDDAGNIFSPYYPKTYSTDKFYNCVYKIKVNEASIPYFTVSNMDLFPKSDFVEVYEAKDGIAVQPVLQNLTATNRGNPVRSSTNELLIRFRTTVDVINSYMGFLSTYKSEAPIPGCGGNFGEFGTTGVINAPGYPSDQLDYLNCKYRISFPPGYQISLKLTEVSLYDVGRGNLTVYDGPTADGRNIILSFNKTATTPLFANSTSNEMLVWYTTTGGSYASRGFSGLYTAFIL